MKVALEIHGPFGLHHWTIYEKVEIKRLRVLSPRSQYCNTLESGDDGNNIWLVIARKLTFLKGDADCSRVDFFSLLFAITQWWWVCWHLKFFLSQERCCSVLSVKFSIGRSVFCLLVFRQGVNSPAPTSILHHGEYINKNFPELLTGCCAQAMNFQT